MVNSPEWVGLLQIPMVLLVVFAISRPLSAYMAKVALGQPTCMDWALSPLADWFYRAININPECGQRWQSYALAVASLNLAGAAFLILLQLFQGVIFSHPGIGFLQAFNTAISFVTNTDWQSYSPEETLDNRVQMAGLSVQMFLSAGTGMAVALALTRAFMAGKTENKTIGNFWVDCTRMVLWVLLPLSFIFGLVFITFGIPQSCYEPIASQEAIKLLGTNGGGFFSANSAHPLECPSALCSLFQTGAMLLIAVSLPLTFGKMVGEPAQGKTLLKAMVWMFGIALVLALLAQGQAIKSLKNIPEGMETAFGWVGTVFFNVAATTTGTGATSAALSSLPPLTGMELLSNILSGGVIFGGAGSGLYQIILYAILSVFLAGLMVGRTPEYLGKKIEAFEMKMVVVAIMLPALAILALTAVASVYAPEAALNHGPHGLTEILFAYTSATFNNGSSFAGLKTGMGFYQVTTLLAMAIGRYVVIFAVLALAGSLIQKPKIPATAATFPTTGGLFAGLLIGVIAITSGLVFFPVVSLGPLAEQVSPWPSPALS